MIVEVRVPYLGDIGDSKVVSINKKVGDRVETGEILFEIEAEKTVYVIEAPASGVVESIEVKLGDKIYPGEILARIRELK